MQASKHPRPTLKTLLKVAFLSETHKELGPQGDIHIWRMGKNGCLQIFNKQKANKKTNRLYCKKQRVTLIRLCSVCMD